MPTPKSPPIKITKRQEAILNKITRRATADQREVNRAKVILLIAHGLPNSRVSRQSGHSLPMVKDWRYRWLSEQANILKLEEESPEDKKLEQKIQDILQDRPRSGTPPTYTSEEYCQILNVALEPPENSDRPISHWTSDELSDECKKRKITSGISARQIGRFLKRSGLKTSP
jgi:putative transposase